MDIVGFSKLPSDEQTRINARLKHIVLTSDEFKRSRESDELISLPTGDGMALAFFNRLDAAVSSAVEITRAIQAQSLCHIRMGIHSGPVFVVQDINGKRNISGAGINLAERTMSCGDSGHILLSDNVAQSLRHLSAWRSKLHDLGQCRVKDGWVRVWNFVDGPIGNSNRPRTSRKSLQRRSILLTAVVLILLAGGATGMFWMGRTSKLSDSAERPTIAVLPFKSFATDKSEEYFGDGIADELLNELTKIPGLRVAAGSSSFQLKDTPLDSNTIGSKLHVNTLLEGTVRKEGGRARVSVELVRAADGFRIWSASFDRELDDIFAVQSEIAQKVSEALKVQLLSGSEPTRTTSGASYDAFLQGKYHLSRADKKSLEQAVHYFRTSIQLDSRSAAAWVGLAEALTLQSGGAYIDSKTGIDNARDAVRRALKLAPDFGEAYNALAELQMTWDWDFVSADASYRRALELEPGNASVMRGAAALKMYQGQFDQAIKLFREAIALDPLNSRAYKNFGRLLHYSSQQDEAALMLHRAIELNDETAFAHYFLGQVLMARGQLDEALAESRKETHPVYRALGLSLVNRALGRKEESDRQLADLERQEGDYQIAEAYAARSQTDKAFEWLERSLKAHDPGLLEIKGDPLMANLRADARYRDLLRKMQLPL